MGQAADQVEWEGSHSEATRHVDRVRCFSNKMGSFMSGHTDGRCLVSRGEGISHNLPGTASSNISSEDLFEERGKQICSTAFRQSDSSGIYRQLGRDSLRPGNDASKKSMDVEPRKRINTPGTVSPRGEECKGRLGVMGDERPLRLDAESSDLPANFEAIPRPEDRPIHVPPILPATSLLQLETRPPSRRNRCLHPGMGGAKGICEPSLEPDRESSDKDRGPEGRPGTHSPVWLSQPWYPRLFNLLIYCSLPAEDQATKQSTADGTGGGGAPARGNPFPARVAYLWQHYMNKRISRKATDLFLSSWRQKSAQSSDSLCRKWIGWCAERSLNPVSGTTCTEDVVNFLAHLHMEGYKYRSLNSCRSAIASMHAHVDGVSIGQHPLVSRLMKGAFHERPPLPRYVGTWDVATVLTHLKRHDLHSSDLSLLALTLHTVMLMALVRPSRSSDLSKLDLAGFFVHARN